jgi:predicted RNA binding protein YcfA (HicA-like mRNA interferase family)
MKLRQALRQLRRAGWRRIRKRATAHAIWQRGPDRLIVSENDPLSPGAIAKIRRAIAHP